MAWPSLAASFLFAAGGVCLCFSCFHMLVLLPRWRRSMRALARMTDEDRHAFEDVVPALKTAESKRGGAERRKSFS